MEAGYWRILIIITDHETCDKHPGKIVTLICYKFRTLFLHSVFDLSVAYQP